MTPARCGAQIRPSQTQVEVETCSARWSSRQSESATTNHAFSVCSLWPLFLLTAGGLLALILACRRCSRRLRAPAAHTRGVEIELSEGLLPLITKMLTVQPGQHLDGIAWRDAAAGSMSAWTGLASQSPASCLPLATLEHSQAVLSAARRPRFLEVNEQDPDSLLGQGGFGRTYRGRLHSLDWRRIDKVAVKFPKLIEIDASGAYHERFKDEAVRLAGMTLDGGVPHPCLVQVLAFVPERCAIVMELCEGDLQWFRSEGPRQELACG
eukprot:1243502-Amphidinium_carterae.1